MSSKKTIVLRLVARPSGIIQNLDVTMHLKVLLFTGLFTATATATAYDQQCLRNPASGKLVALPDLQRAINSVSNK